MTCHGILQSVLDSAPGATYVREANSVVSHMQKPHLHVVCSRLALHRAALPRVQVEK